MGGRGERRGKRKRRADGMRERIGVRRGPSKRIGASPQENSACWPPFCSGSASDASDARGGSFRCEKGRRHHWRCRGQGGAGRGQTRSGRGSGSAAARQPMPLRRRRFSRGHGRRALVARADSRSVKRAARVSSEETRPWRANPHAHKARNTPKERERERERERGGGERKRKSVSSIQYLFSSFIVL